MIDVSGAEVSTVNDRVAGVASTLPRRVGRADRERVRAVRERTDAHAARCSSRSVPVVAPGPSSLHSNVEPASVEVKLNDGEVTFVVPVGPR